ncbi:MAG: hypothetical protein STSR0009_15950 [Methanoregula sp.]
MQEKKAVNRGVKGSPDLMHRTITVLKPDVQVCKDRNKYPDRMMTTGNDSGDNAGSSREQFAVFMPYN